MSGGLKKGGWTAHRSLYALDSLQREGLSYSGCRRFYKARSDSGSLSHFQSGLRLTEQLLSEYGSCDLDDQAGS